MTAEIKNLEEERLRRNAYARKWRQEHPDRARAANKKYRGRFRRAKWRYGLAREEFLLIEDRLNNGPCEGCGAMGKMHIDHDHRTKKFRGILCMNCNHALGNVRDSIQTLRLLVVYLEKRG